MDFFNSLTLDLKFLVIGIVGCAVLALFSGNHGAEKRYLVIMALLGAAGVYRFSQTSPVEVREGPSPTFVKAEPKRAPLVSTSAK